MEPEIPLNQASAKKDMQSGNEVGVNKIERKFGFASALAGVLFATAGPLKAEVSQPRVMAPAGEVEGAAFAGGEAYQGIPYAKAPVGPLRWRAPAPLPAFNGVRDATKPGYACMQVDQGWNAIDSSRASEDCLNLNVWRPASKGPQPVMVWFHGGAFVGGAGNSPLYDGEKLARAGVMLVTVNYRLGVFGYFAHPGLSSENPQGISGNYGLLDQIAALQWVHDNIAAFGGDPGNVTIFGQSAGAASVGFLLASPKARGLFSKAILQSGAPYGMALGRPKTLQDAQDANRTFGTIAELRQTDAKDLMTRWNAFADSSSEDTLRLSPVVDGVVLPGLPADIFGQGGLKGRHILLGNASREMPMALSGEKVRAVAGQHFGKNAPKVLQAYKKKADSVRQGSIGEQLMTDLMFGCPSHDMANAADRAWLYEFAQPSPGEAAVRHSSDLTYTFGNPERDGGVLSTRPFNADEARLSDIVIRYWTNFARTGNPNGPGLVKWSVYSANRPIGIRFGEGKARRDRIGSPACDDLLKRGG